jgi:SAM-dependent methyltransferase
MSIIKERTNFELDKKREFLIQRKSFNKFKNTYYHSSKLKNPNTQRFWDKNIENGLSLTDIDRMTMDRIKSAVNCVNSNVKKLLDIGLGYGYFEREIIKIHPRIRLFGIDISKYSISIINKNILGKFKIGSILKIPFHEKFDVVVALEILEHLHFSQTFQAFKEIKRVLKNKGQLIISVPINENYSDKYNPNHHLRGYSSSIIQEELKLADFRIKKIKFFYAFSTMYSLKNILKYLFPNRWKPNIILINAIKK